MNRFMLGFSRQFEIAQTGVQAGMSYYINNTMSIISDPLAPFRTAGASDPGGRLDRIWNVAGPGVHVLLGQKFYTLE